MHPELLLPCPACAGSGWGPEVARAEDRGLRWSDLGRTPVGALAAHFHASPSLGRPLREAVELGLGAFRLGEPLARLPLAARQLAPLAAAAAPSAVPADQR